MNDILNDELNSAFVQAERQFKGETIAPYTEGSRLLLLQVRDEEDSSIFFIWAFLYMHIQIAKNRKEAIKLAWNKNTFREKVMEWVENKTEADRVEATKIVSAIMEESQNAQVEIVDSKSQGGNA